MEQPSAEVLAMRPIQLPTHARILVARMGDMGDALLLTPLLRALRARYPGARIDALLSLSGRAMLGECPHLDSIYTLQTPSTLTAMQLPALARLLATLRSVRYDALIFANHLTLDSGRRWRRWLALALAPWLTVGLDNGRGDFLNISVPDEGFGARHEVEYALALGATLDARIPDAMRAPRLSDLGWHDIQPAVWALGAPRRVALHPGSGAYSLARRWPATRWAQLARALHLEFAVEITLVGGSEEHELMRSIADALGAPGWVGVQERAPSLRRLAETLAAAHLFIGNDSLPMHMATAAGVPVVAIFGPSNARAWGPYAPSEPERVAVIRRDDLPCSPCIYRGHELGTPQGCPPRSCLTELEIGPALIAARRLLRRVWSEPRA